MQVYVAQVGHVLSSGLKFEQLRPVPAHVLRGQWRTNLPEEVIKANRIAAWRQRPLPAGAYHIKHSQTMRQAKLRRSTCVWNTHPYISRQVEQAVI